MSGKLKVTYHIIADYQLDISGASEEEIAERGADIKVLREKRYALTSLYYDTARQKLFVGTTNSAGDLLVVFDPETCSFESLGYKCIWDDTEAKIHRGLWPAEDGKALYFATSTLSPISKIWNQPGGKIVRYEIETGKFEVLGRCAPGKFIQASDLDEERGLMYLFCYPAFSFGVFSTRERKHLLDVFVGSIPHISAIDDDGGVWGTQNAHRHSFFRYDPNSNDLEFMNDFALPSARRAAGVMYTGAGPIDCMINGGDGYIYISTALAELYRLDPRKREVTFLGKPYAGNRLPALVVGKDGLIYGAGGDSGTCQLFTYDREARRFDILGSIVAEDGIGCYRTHDMALVDNVAYIGETDNPRRSGYLWKVEF